MGFVVMAESGEGESRVSIGVDYDDATLAVLGIRIKGRRALNVSIKIHDDQRVVIAERSDVDADAEGDSRIINLSAKRMKMRRQAIDPAESDDGPSRTGTYLALPVEMGNLVTEIR